MSPHSDRAADGLTQAQLPTTTLTSLPNEVLVQILRGAFESQYRTGNRYYAGLRTLCRRFNQVVLPLMLRDVHISSQVPQLDALSSLLGILDRDPGHAATIRKLSCSLCGPLEAVEGVRRRRQQFERKERRHRERRDRHGGAEAQHSHYHSQDRVRRTPSPSALEARARGRRRGEKLVQRAFEALIDLLGRTADSLTHLHLYLSDDEGWSGDSVKNALLGRLRAASKLRDLMIMPSRTTSPSQILDACPLGIEQLSISECWPAQRYYAASIATPSGLYETLREFDLSWVHTPDELGVMLRAMPNLDHLALGVSITRWEWHVLEEQLASQTNQIRSVALKVHCDDRTPTNVALALSDFTKLEVLSVRSAMLDEESVWTLPSNLLHLKLDDISPEGGDDDWDWGTWDALAARISEDSGFYLSTLNIDDIRMQAYDQNVMERAVLSVDEHGHTHRAGMADLEAACEQFGIYYSYGRDSPYVPRPAPISDE